MIGIHISHLASDNILNSHTAAFKQIPHSVVQQNTLVVLARQRLSDIKSAHTAELLLLLKEEKLVGLHIELTTNPGIIVYHDIIYPKGIQLLAACQACRTRTDDSHLGLVHLHLSRFLIPHARQLAFAAVDATNLLNTVDQCHTYTAHLAVDQHLAGSTLAYTTVKTTVTAVQAVTVYRETCLM